MADPLDAQAAVAPAVHASSLARYKPAGDLSVGSWREANDTVARIGGDEFVMLINDIATDMESGGRSALLAAEAVRATLEAPYTIDTHLYSSTGSIGITLFPKHSEEVEDLLRGIRQGVEGGDDVDPAVCGARGGRAAGQGERAQDQRREYASQHDNHSQLK